MIAFETITIEDATEAIIDYRGKTPPKTDSGIQLITAKVIKDGRILEEPKEFIAAEFYDQWMRRGLPQRFDVLITTEAPLGEVAILRGDAKIALAQRVILLRARRGKIDPLFLFYGLQSDFGQRELRARASGAIVSGIKQSELRQVRIPLFPLAVQRRVAGVLSAYDELMEICQRRIRILEGMLRGLFREWFIDFRVPGYKKVPLVDCVLGRIPDEWEATLAEHVDFKEGPGLRNWQYRDAGIPFLNIRTLVDNDIDFSKIQFLDPEEVQAKYKHFLLHEYDHVVSSSGTIGRIVTIRAEHLPLMLNTSTIRMRPKGSRVGRWLLKHFMLSDYFQNQAKSFAIGAAQPNFGPIHLKQMKIIAPTEDIAAKYERLAEPMELQILSLARRIQNLRRTRDLVLPRLLSGQVQLDSEIDKVRETTT